MALFDELRRGLNAHPALFAAQILRSWAIQVDDLVAVERDRVFRRNERLAAVKTSGDRPRSAAEASLIPF
jgi:hypothetical protein